MKYFISLFFLLILHSCVSEKEDGLVVADETLIAQAKNTSSFTFFRNRTDTLQTDPSSEHGLYMRVRMNSRALSVMNDSTSAATAVFPDESIIVKEMYDTKGGPLTGFVVMYKLRSGSNENHGWLWGEYKSDGTPLYSVAKNGERCLGCHLESPNQDLIRTFGLH
jgi:hypothetical protein